MPGYGIRFLFDQKSPARDGVKLSTDVFLPDAAGPFPTIFLRTPYDSLRDAHIDWACWWARRGYACAIQENRGRFKSEGVYYAYHDDGQDGHDGVEWVANQSWCNGKIGMSGRSYGGIVQWQASRFRPPHLTAMAP